MLLNVNVLCQDLTLFSLMEISTNEIRASLQENIREGQNGLNTLSTRLTNYLQDCERAKKEAKKQKRKAIIRTVIGITIGAFFAPIMANALVFQLGRLGITFGQYITHVTFAFKGAFSGAINATFNNKRKIGQETLFGAITYVFGHVVGGQLGKIPILAKECIQETAKGVANSALHQENEKNLLKNLGVNVGTTLLVGGSSNDTPTASIKEAFVETTKALPRTLLKTTVTAGLTSAIYKTPLKETLPIALASNIAQAYAGAAGDHIGNKIEVARIKEEQRSKPQVSEPEVRFQIAKSTKSPALKDGSIATSPAKKPLSTINRQEVNNKKVESIVREIKKMLPSDSVNDKTLEKIVREQLQKYSGKNLAKFAQELYNSDVGFRMYAIQRVAQTTNSSNSGYQEVAAPLVIPTYALAATFIAWVGCGEYQRSSSLSFGTNSKGISDADVIRNNEETKRIYEQGEQLFAFKKFNNKEGEKNSNIPPIDLPKKSKDWIKLKGNQGWKHKDGTIWTKDKLHKDHWDIKNSNGEKIKEVDFFGKQIWPNGPKNKNKLPSI